MNQKRLLIFKQITIAVGTASLLVALVELSPNVLSLGFVAIAAFSIMLAPRMVIQLPKSRFAISFSDAAVFLTFLFYGGPAAVLMAAIESTANCQYLRRKNFPFGKLMMPTNISVNIIAMTFSYIVWLMVPSGAIVRAQFGSTQHLVVTLGCLAIAQFVITSGFLSIFAWMRNGANPWTTWRQGCFTSSITQVVGAGIAGLVFKLIGFGDPVVEVIAFAAIGFVYFSYRQSIAELDTAITQAESAERGKAETEKKRREEAEDANEALSYAALHDPLTDLPNRKHFGDTLAELIDRYEKDPSKTFYVMFLDIRRFKDINDSLGHSVGDKVLTIAAKRFVRLLKPMDMVARIGGDEFAVILRDVSCTEKAEKVAQRLRKSIGRPFTMSGKSVALSLNIGIAPCDAEYRTPEEILRDADIAMHYAKEKNSGVAVFTKDLRVKFLERVRIENDLRQAIERSELSMHYQPLVSLADGGLMGFEALLRWRHSEMGMIPPDKFIPIAEESGLIIPITKWILSTTTNQLADWQKINPRYRELLVSVNISGKHMSTDELIENVATVLETSGIAPATLKLEITESAAMENAEHTISVLNRLHDLGVQLSIDDFGTGYSSLSYLHRLPFDTLKIDRSFVCRVGESGENSEILETIISLAKNLKKHVIAEGIETEAQLGLLQRLGCDYGQGYLLAKPQTRENAEKMLYDGTIFLPASLQEQIETSLAHESAAMPWQSRAKDGRALQMSHD